MYTTYLKYKNKAQLCAWGFESSDCRLEFSRSFCERVIISYWRSICSREKKSFEMVTCPLETSPIESEADVLAKLLGEIISEFPAEDAGFLIGSVYTALLPSILRSTYGAYYTPPPLIARILELAEKSGVDFTSARIIDPACGGGAFLAPTALKIIKASPNRDPSFILENINSRVNGIELDPFAAWISHVLLEAMLLPYCIASNSRLNQVIHVGNALDSERSAEFDLVIGNPPYGKTSLTSELRDKYSRSLFGHANLYGLFVDLSLRLVKKQGVVALITPTSFLGGQYFKKLRYLITSETSASHFEFVKDRNGVFDGVQQETIITTYTSSTLHSGLKISELVPEGLNTFKVNIIGKGHIGKGESPWLLPREFADVELLAKATRQTNTFKKMGLHVSTGPLVWNQHKKNLNHDGEGLPLIWAHHITHLGLKLTPSPQGHGDHVRVMQDKQKLITREQCIIVKRTTSKEQNRRILATLLPQAIIDKSGGVYIENHINMMHYKAPPIIALEVIVLLLNSNIVDRIFRCVSGSTAVSAYELNTLPLPSIDKLKNIEKLMLDGMSIEGLEQSIEKSYDLQ